MGNIIRLAIARIGLSINTFIAGRTLHKGRRKSIVILVLGAQEAGKTTVVSRISKRNWENSSLVIDKTYLPTKGFSVQEIKEKKIMIKLYDIGGSTPVRELWTHYFAEAHGIIYVIDASGESVPIKESAEIFANLLKDDRIKRKPILILGNKQDIPGALNEKELTNAMNLVEVVNNAKCLTRLDLSSIIEKSKSDGSGPNLFVGFKWLVSYIKWNWLEIEDRVIRDSLKERHREKAKFERARKEAKEKEQENKLQDNQILNGNPSNSNRQRLSNPEIHSGRVKRKVSFGEFRKVKSARETVTDQEPEIKISVLPMPFPPRPEPEGGNDKENLSDSDGDDTYKHPEVVIVEAKAQIHKESISNGNIFQSDSLSEDQLSISNPSYVVVNEVNVKGQVESQNQRSKSVSVIAGSGTGKRKKNFKNNKTAPSSCDEGHNNPVDGPKIFTISRPNSSAFTSN